MPSHSEKLIAMRDWLIEQDDKELEWMLEHIKSEMDARAQEDACHMHARGY
ncbi:MAG: hypothetical protein GQ553_04455 [Nitrosomonadaceae bacterium]|nr:hypothetical protein [Nitrosomonadaceae bacterium]